MSAIPEIAGIDHGDISKSNVGIRRKCPDTPVIIDWGEAQPGNALLAVGAVMEAYPTLRASDAAVYDYIEAVSRGVGCPDVRTIAASAI